MSSALGTQAQVLIESSAAEPSPPTLSGEREQSTFATLLR